MPRKAQFTREDFINTAFTIAREQGIGQITAREVGQRLECSTRPMFTYFDSVEELKSTVAGKASALFLEKLLESLDSKAPLTSLGLAIVDFSKAEPNLKPLCTSGSQLKQILDALKESAREKLMKIYSLSEGQINFALTAIVLFSINLADLGLSDEETRRMLGQTEFAYLKALREAPGFLRGEFGASQRSSQFASWID